MIWAKCGRPVMPRPRASASSRVISKPNSRRRAARRTLRSRREACMSSTHSRNPASPSSSGNIPAGGPNGRAAWWKARCRRPAPRRRWRASGPRLVVAGEGVVVGDAQRRPRRRAPLPRSVARANRCRRTHWCANADRSKETRPKRSSVAQIRSTLCSGVSWAEFTVTSGSSGGS